MTDRLGIFPFWLGYDRKTALRAAVLADELGYDSIWLAEGWGYEVFTLLTEIALATKRIRVGTGIVNVFSRSPGVLAMSAATLDDVSGGRFVLGLGTSGRRVIEGFHARPFRKPLTQLKDVIRVVRALLAGLPIDAAGTELSSHRSFRLELEREKRQVPIYVAALRRASIETIGELADGWMPTFWPHERLEDGLAWIRAGAERAGRDPSAITCAPFTTALPIGHEAGRRRSREGIAFYVGGMGDYYRELLERFGFREECARITDLYRDKTTRGEAVDAVTDAMVDALCVVGTANECVEELRRRRNYGIDLPILNLPDMSSWDVLEAFLRDLAPSR